MSMRDYPVIENAAFFISPEVMAYIALKYDTENNSIPDNIKPLLENNTFAAAARNDTLPLQGTDGKIPYKYNDSEEAYRYFDRHCCHCREFEGELTLAFSEKAADKRHDNTSFDGDFIAYIPSPKAPDLFTAVYNNSDELVADYQKIFKDAGVLLPDDFDWYGHIVDIDGTYYA